MMTLQIHTGGINLKKKNIYSIRKLMVLSKALKMIQAKVLTF